jgi:hypothetical protein
MRTLLLVAALAVAAASAARAEICQGRLLATVEADGAVSEGSRAAVVRAARDGAPIRVGWELGPRRAPVLVHWQDARFITVFEDQVFAQIGDIHEQFGDTGKAHVDFGKAWSLWLASIGTDGRMVGRLSAEAAPTETRLVSHWCLAS